MLSRIADSMFWLNRYFERAEGMLRMLHTSYVLSLDKGPDGTNPWKTLLEIFTYLSEEEMSEIEKSASATMHFVLLDTKNPNSLKIIQQSRHGAKASKQRSSFHDRTSS